MKPAHNPLYDDALGDWQACRDVHAGETQVKQRGARYLPPTPGMRADGFPNAGAGWFAYCAYRDRAVFPSIYADAIQVALGVLHREPAMIELPAKLEGMRANATGDGGDIQALLRRINLEQLAVGRLGLYVDPIDGSPALTPPLVHVYGAEQIINWDWPQMVVLDESGHARRDDDSWDMEQRFRRLSLRDGVYVNETTSGDRFDTSVKPVLSGSTLDAIPFVFVNAADLFPSPASPPLLGLAQAALGIYRGEADYRQSLFAQGQDTLVVIGSTEKDFRVGASAVINLPAGTGVDAKYIGVSADGLSEQRTALENDYARALRLAMGTLDTATRERESGEALQTRVQSATASLTQIAIAGAAGLERALRIAAKWAGANPDEVKVSPNLAFAQDTFDAKELTELLSAKQMGAPISLRTIHEILAQKDMVSRSFEDEIAEIEDEAEGALASGVDG